MAFQNENLQKFTSNLKFGNTFEENYKFSNIWFKLICCDIFRERWFVSQPLWRRLFLSILLSLAYFVPFSGVYCAIYTFPDSQADQLASILPAIFSFIIGVKATFYIGYSEKLRLLTGTAIKNCQLQNVDPNYRKILNKYQVTCRMLVKFLMFVWFCSGGMFIMYPLIAMNFFGQSKMYPLNFLIPGSP